MELFTELNEHHSTTFIIATHDQRVMGYAKRLIRMLDGRIVDAIRPSDQVQIEEWYFDTVPIA